MLTTLEYWINGNFYSMWYIAITLVLYAIFPGVFTSLVNKKYDYRIVTIIWMVGVIILIEILRCWNTDYVDMVGIGVCKIPCFIFGAFLARSAEESEELQCRIYKYSILTTLLLSILIGWLYFRNGQLNYYFYFGDVSKMMFILLIVWGLTKISSFSFFISIKSFFEWFGKYSLELYLLHVLLLIVLTDVITPDYLRMVIAMILSLMFSPVIHTAMEKLEN